jgi:hypothetical protein
LSLVAIVVLVLMLSAAGRLVHLAVRIALLIALIALVASYGAREARQHERASPPAPAIRRHDPR